MEHSVFATDEFCTTAKTEVILFWGLPMLTVLLHDETKSEGAEKLHYIL
jgi:hypothetical protein